MSLSTLCCWKQQHVLSSACNFVVKVAFQEQYASGFVFHKPVYEGVHEQFRLSVQLTVRAMAKPTGCCKHDKSKPCF